MAPQSMLKLLCIAPLLPMPGVAVAQPPEPPGPSLSVQETVLAQALTCPKRIQHPGSNPVLLVHGTSVNAPENWSWNYLLGLAHGGLDVCMVTLPNRALDDIQVASEYVVYAIRTMARAWNSKVDVVGLSQGGLEPRWALRFWPDLQRLVDDLVTLGTPHHGTLAANLLCRTGLCTEAVWQMRIGSQLLQALNQDDETPGDVSYTSIFSASDGLVFGPPGMSTSALAGASNVRIQDLCPLRPVTHVALAYDAVAFAVVMDALTHPGPAQPERIERRVCWQWAFPGVRPWELIRAGRHHVNGWEAPRFSRSEPVGAGYLKSFRAQR